MHIQRFEIRDLGPLQRVSWDAGEHLAGWHVIIGDNGSGKSTLLKAISLGILGVEEALWLRVRPDELVRRGREKGVSTIHWSNGQLSEYVTTERLKKGIRKGSNTFHCAFGPVRSFSLDVSSQQRAQGGDLGVARHLPLFDEKWSYAVLLDWLQRLKVAEGEAESQRKNHLALVRGFLNRPGLLPEGAFFDDVHSEHGPVFGFPGDQRFGLQSLSDGYKSVLGLTLQLLRYLLDMAPTDTAPLDQREGVVLIDEIDAHLHPKWQQRIGAFFTSAFPGLQFIVTTHSPLVCRAAERGTILHLPAHHSGDPPRMVQGEARDRLLYGDVLDAFGTGAFGSRVTQGETGQQKLERLAELNLMALSEPGLSTTEERERTELRGIFKQDPIA